MYLRKLNRIGMTPFAWNSYFSIFVHRVQYLRTLYLEQIIILSVEFNNWHTSITAVLFCLWNIYLFEKQKFDGKQLKLKKYLEHVS